VRRTFGLSTRQSVRNLKRLAGRSGHFARLCAAGDTTQEIEARRCTPQALATHLSHVDWPSVRVEPKFYRDERGKTMRQFATILCLVILTTVVAAAPSSSAIVAPTGTLHSEVVERGNFKAMLGNHLRNHDFDELERLAQTLIKDDARYACGSSKLVDFYTVLEPSGATGPDGVDARAAAFAAWENAKPNSHWPKVGFSKVEQWRGAEARGGGWARDVTPKQWAEHDQHMKLAMEWGLKAVADNAGDPELFTHMIGVCRNLQCPKEQADRWLAAALAINPNFDAVYITMANALVSRWLGSADAFVDFAEQSSDENKALGNIVYARIATVALLIDKDKLRETYPRLQWERIENGLRQIDKRYPDSARTFHLLARFACLYGDRAVAREAMARLDNSFTGDAVQYWDSAASFQNARDWAMEAPGTTR
jgi:Domain of unknown function (DUF4034)